MKRTKHYRLMLSVVVILPMFFFLALLGANTEQLSTYGSPQAAIVNNDSPVTLTTGQILPAGRQVIATLTDPKRETRFEWAVVSSASAENGLKDGTYEAVVDIPQNFSASVAGILQSTSTTPGTLIVRTNGTSALLADLSNDIVSAAGKDLSTSFTVSYLTESLAATSQIKDGFSQAADGAGQLADGARQLADGNAQLADGAAQAADGAGQLADGARQLADGNAQLADGAAELASGVSQLSAGTQPLHAGASALASGLRQYVNGVNQAADGSIPLAAGAKEFAGGVAQYVNGVQQIYDGITTPQPGQSTSMLGGAQQLADALTAVASGIHSVADEIVKLLPEGITAASASAQLLSDAFDELTTLIEQCGAGDQNACAQATQGTATTAQELAKLVTQLQQVAELAEAGKINLEELTKITNPVDQLAGGARSLADGLGTLSEQMKSNMLGDNAAALTAGGTQLADGVAELSDGLGQLKAGAPQLLNGASALSGGTSELADGTSQLAGGAQALANGAREAADGTALFANGTTQAADGLGQLADGASALTDGGQQLTSGSQQLASELDKAAQQIPTYTRTDAEKTAQALGTPVSVSASSALVDPRSALAPGIIALALWLGSFGVIIYRSSMTDDKLREPFTPLALITRSLVSAIGIGAAQSLLVMIGLAVSRVPIAHLFWLIIVLLLSSFTMIALHVAFTATLGMKGGGVLSLVFLGLQLVSLSTLLPVASQSALVSALHIFLPVPQAQDALTSAITGVGSSSVAVWMLIFWFLASGFISVAAVAKRRAVSVPSLRAFAAHYWPLIRR
ncbi:MAG: YhgE/Pip domain-containing protein [Actinomycetaceae bacterium]|nr:YhgE/Pip domain-containing protein [Actinomycetaceae bacterium]